MKMNLMNFDQLSKAISVTLSSINVTAIETS